MAATATQMTAHDPVVPAIGCALDDVAIHPLGGHAQYFDYNLGEDAIHIRPRSALLQRCSIRPMALFQHPRGYTEVNTVMGRLHFSRDTTTPAEYRPFTLDADRTLKELFFPVEAAPYDDDWMPGVQRWRNWETVAKHLLNRAKIEWRGLPDRRIDQLLQFQRWSEPIVPCVLHALAQAYHDRGACVIEVGSLRGRSTSLLAMALDDVGSEVPIISVDPHDNQPCNLDLVRVSLAQTGQEKRLIQMPYTSQRAAHWIRPSSASFIHINGVHTYESIAIDIEYYSHLLAPGGCIACHHYGWGKHDGQPELYPDVRRAVDELMFDHDMFRPLLLSHSLMVFEKESRC